MKEKILIAISDPSLLSSIKTKLEELNYDVFSTNNGKDAIEKMKTISPDLVLIDIVLSIKNGYEVLEEKSYDRLITKIPVIVISNSGIALEMNKIPSTPTIKDFLIKTHIEVDEVIEKIGKILGKNLNNKDSNTKLRGVGKKILWVEDDKLLSTILLKKFENLGYSLLKANEGEEALSLLSSETPNVIVLDILLPGISGFDILQKIRMEEKFKKIPVIMLSNLGKQSDIDQAKLLGANKFLVKAAVSLDEIIKEVENFV